MTPFSLRLAIAAGESIDDRCANAAIAASLRNDVLAVQAYRLTVTTNDNESWLVPERDFVLTAEGLRLAKFRYFRRGESVQRAWLRIARIFALDRDNATVDDELWRMFYDLLSTGMLAVSSSLAAAACDEGEEGRVLDGEACRLFVAHPSYGSATLRQLEEIQHLLARGVGIGLGAEIVPRDGIDEPRRIRTGFLTFMRQLDSYGLVSMHERRPKVAVYLPVHCDTIFAALDCKLPAKAPLENVFVALMIPDYFMHCVRHDLDWHLVSGQRCDPDTGLRLSDYTGEAYAEQHRSWVSRGWYTERHSARSVMNRILASIVTSGSPYVIWSDILDRYNNQRHLGPVKTLNLCAEITNAATAERSSSCTLISANVALWDENGDVLERAIELMSRRWRCNVNAAIEAQQQQQQQRDMARYAFVLGYMGTVALNRLLTRRSGGGSSNEIGVSPMGMFDAALVQCSDTAPPLLERCLETCALMSELLYKGAVSASCDEFAATSRLCPHWAGSAFSRGVPQFALRDPSSLASDWGELRERMRLGMANSMLTAQAPTATTAQLTGVTESVCLPIDSCITKESSNGRALAISHGIVRLCASRPSRLPEMRELLFNGSGISEDEEASGALRMFEVSAPFVDQSQSVIVNLRLDKRLVFRHLVRSWNEGRGLKTGLYYFVPRQTRPTLRIADAAGKSNCDACSM